MPTNPRPAPRRGTKARPLTAEEAARLGRIPATADTRPAATRPATRTA